MDPSPSLLGSSIYYFECFGWKTKLENCNQFSIITLPLKTEKLSHATDCNIIGRAKLPLCFIFLFIVDRIKLKYRLRFNILSKGKIVKNFRFGTFLFFMIKNNKNQTKNVNFQFLILKENWTVEWHTDPLGQDRSKCGKQTQLTWQSGTT